MLELIGASEPIERLLDIGTGSGRILELLAPVSERSIGLDVSRDMVALARAKLGQARLSHASVRQGDLHRPPFEASSFDVAVMHHVLHLLDDPARRSPTRRGCCARAAGCWSPTSRPISSSSCASATAIATSASPTAQMRELGAQAGLAIETERTLAPSPPGEPARPCALWLLRARPRRDARAPACRGRRSRERRRFRSSSSRRARPRRTSASGRRSSASRRSTPRSCR